jgi:hypothetical protein
MIGSNINLNSLSSIGTAAISIPKHYLTTVMFPCPSYVVSNNNYIDDYNKFIIRKKLSDTLIAIAAK